MRAGRLEEILFGDEKIFVCGANKPIEKAYSTEWLVMDFARKFPNTEVIKITIIKGKLHVLVYDDSAKALSEKRYDDVIKYSEELEHHTFNSDMNKKTMTLKDLNDFANENGLPEDVGLFVFGKISFLAVMGISTETPSKDALYTNIYFEIEEESNIKNSN